MENKELRNILLNNMKLLKISLLENIKNELKDFAQIQRELKKSRKLEFRPKDKSLQSICDEISSNSYKISLLIYYYRWIRHGLKYWSNRDIHDFWEYQKSKEYNPNGGYADSTRYQKVWWSREKGSITSTYEDYVKGQFEQWILNLIEKNHIEISNEQIDELVEYLYKNI